MCVFPLGDYLKEGIKINTPHYLCKLTDIIKGTRLYTLIVAQFENVTIHYTLKVNKGVLLVYSILLHFTGLLHSRIQSNKDP